MSELISPGTAWSLATLSSLIPLLWLSGLAVGRADATGLGNDAGPEGAWWAALAVAAGGPALWSAWQMADHWSGGLTNTLWLSVAVCLTLFAGVSALSRGAWRLSALLVPYLACTGVVATLLADRPGRMLRGGAPESWLDLHIAVSVATYALLTLAAMAALGSFIQLRALKSKKFNRLTRFLPAAADSDRLLVRLLIASETVLGLGLVTGMAVEHFEIGILLRLDHKTLLSVAAFCVIGLLLAVHTRSGLRGRTAARLVLIAFLLLTLAYPGVKFVTTVLIY